MLNYGWNAEENIANNGRQTSYTIPVDNAFLPANLQQQMVAQGIQSLTLGTAAIENWQSTNDVSLTNIHNSLAQNFVQNYRQLYRGVFTLTGVLQSARRGLVLERLRPEQFGARAAMGAATTP